MIRAYEGTLNRSRSKVLGNKKMLSVGRLHKNIIEGQGIKTTRLALWLFVEDYKYTPHLKRLSKHLFPKFGLGYRKR